MFGQAELRLAKFVTSQTSINKVINKNLGVWRGEVTASVFIRLACWEYLLLFHDTFIHEKHGKLALWLQ